jgi:hypothetical protein
MCSGLGMLRPPEAVLLSGIAQTASRKTHRAKRVAQDASRKAHRVKRIA